MEEARKSFHRELNDIQQELVRISAGVVESIPKCTTVLLEQDLSAAETMIYAAYTGRRQLAWSFFDVAESTLPAYSN